MKALSACGGVRGFSRPSFPGLAFSGRYIGGGSPSSVEGDAAPVAAPPFLKPCMDLPFPGASAHLPTHLPAPGPSGPGASRVSPSPSFLTPRLAPATLSCLPGPCLVKSWSSLRCHLLGGAGTFPTPPWTTEGPQLRAPTPTASAQATRSDGSSARRFLQGRNH